MTRPADQLCEIAKVPPGGARCPRRATITLVVTLDGGGERRFRLCPRCAVAGHDRGARYVRRASELYQEAL